MAGDIEIRTAFTWADSNRQAREVYQGDTFLFRVSATTTGPWIARYPVSYKVLARGYHLPSVVERAINRLRKAA